MKLVFACPFYGHTPPIINDGFRANIINASEAGHVWVDDYSVSGTQHRNACEAITQRFLTDKREIDALFMTEHDCLLPPMAVVQLCETLEKTPEADCVTGITFRRCEPYNPMVSKIETRYLTPEIYEAMKTSADPYARKAASLVPYEKMKERTLMSLHALDTRDKPFPVDTSSLNCVVFRRRVFETVKDVPDLWAVDDLGLYSIDNAFFLRLRDHGLKLYCDPRVLCGHLGDETIVDVETWMKHSQKLAEQADIKRQDERRKKDGPEPRIYGELTRLADKNKTDKGSLDHRPDSGWMGWVHNYAMIYEAHFDRMRLTAKKVMELGVWHGGSLRMWRDYFPNAQVYGVENDFSQIEGDDWERITLMKADGGERDSLADLVSKIGGEFDLIVDDASHKMADQQTALAVLFPHVKPGGFYVVEDCHTSFFPRPARNAETGEWAKSGEGNQFEIWENGKNATILVLEALSKGVPFESPYMSPEEAAYIYENAAECLIYSKKSMTAVIRKKG